jgi:hypothetical protein
VNKKKEKEKKEEKEIRIDERKEVSRECMSGRGFLARRFVQASESFLPQFLIFLVEVDSEFLDSINFYQFLLQNR